MREIIISIYYARKKTPPFSIKEKNAARVPINKLSSCSGEQS